MRSKTILWLAAVLVLLMSACDRTVPVPVPDVEGDIVLTEEVFQSVEAEEVGSVTLDVVYNFTDGVSYVDCNTTHTVWLQFYENYPDMVSKNKQDYEEVMCEAELIRTGVIGSASTTGTLPVTYTFNTQFAPYPKCELTVQVDLLAAFSQVTVLHDSALGDIPTPDGIGDDLVVSFPSHVFKTSGEPFTVIEGLVTLKITPGDYVIPSWTRCVYP